MAYSTISKPGLHVNTVLYTGTGSELAISGVGFQPDWVWIKRRDATANGGMFDVVRGATKLISTSQNDAEQTLAQSLKSFDSDGFTLGTGPNGYVNTNSSSTVAWNWKAANSQGSSNTDGSINTTYTSVNATAGFSISKYTGTGSNATVGHGLGVAPKMIIFKNTNSTRDWGVYHAAMNDPDAYLSFNQDYAKEDSYNFSNNTAPTNSVFSVGTLNSNNGSSQEYIAYCFAEKKGYSKFGSYKGTGNASGPFIYLGFKPAVVIIKQTNTANHWYMWDNKRDPDNPTAVYNRPDTAGAEGNYEWLDFVSNGIKIRNTSSGASTNGGTYIYMAWAEEPLVANVGSGVPATAR